MPSPILDAKRPSEQILALIGRVASEWAWVEHLLAEMLSHFCTADPGSLYVITQTTSAASIVGWLRTLCRIRVKNPDTVNTLVNLLNEVDDARADRNTVVHGTWFAFEDDAGYGYVNTMKWDRAEVSKTELWSADDLMDVIHEIENLQLKLGNLGLSIGFLRTTNSTA